MRNRNKEELYEVQKEQIQKALEWLRQSGKVKNLDILELEFSTAIYTSFGFEFDEDDNEFPVITINLEELWENSQGSLYSFFHEVGHLIQWNRMGEDYWLEVEKIETNMEQMRFLGTDEKSVERYYRQTDLESTADDIADLLLEQYIVEME